MQITRAFYLGTYQVTQLQWRYIMGSNPSRFEGDDLPVGSVKFGAARELCARLSAALSVNVTLPTEAQWEYACRAGTNTRFYSGDAESDLDRVGWYRENSHETVHPVGHKQPNAWGLYDMLGNLYEPCIDCIRSFARLNDRDPEGPRDETYGAMRGGFYIESAYRCQVYSRSRTNDNFAGMGVRLAIGV
jgi:formylglycine-generating enzyme required for sulfatase activity